MTLAFHLIFKTCPEIHQLEAGWNRTFRNAFKFN